MPAYDEEARGVHDNVRTIVDFLMSRDYSWELVVVDDGSQDRTAEAVESAAAEAGVEVRLLRNSGNRGKGYSVRRGVLEAVGMNVVYIDADLSTPLAELDNLLSSLATFDVAIGSRGLADSDIVVSQPAGRVMLGRVFRVLARVIALPEIKDPMCGFKGFTSQAAREIFSRSRLTGFGFDVEILFIARKLGFSVAEKPVAWSHRTGSRVRYPLVEGIIALRDLFIIRLNDLRGFYDRPR